MDESYGFSSSLYGCESWTIKKPEHWTNDAFELWSKKTPENPFDNKEIKPVNPKGNQPWIFIGRTNIEAEAPILLPSDVESWLIWKDPSAERLRAGGEEDDRGWDGWMASLTQWSWVWAGTLGDSDGQGSVACCSPWGCKQSDMTGCLNHTLALF